MRDKISASKGYQRTLQYGDLSTLDLQYSSRSRGLVNLLERDRDEEVPPDGEAAVLPEFVDLQKRLHVYPITIGNL